MEKEQIFTLKSAYRDDFRVNGYKFGSGEESVCIMGATRGNEIQQLFICSQLVKRLHELEEDGKIAHGKSILVIPSINPYSMNISKRFWSTDNTDINRMFPGYDLGETTQRIAGGVFEKIKNYRHGIQFASFYMQGNISPHVKMMKTGFEDTESAKLFGLPYVVIRTPKPYDTTTLNYNWQLWNKSAFSIYTSETDNIDLDCTQTAILSVMNFLDKKGIINYKCHHGYQPMIINESDMVNIKSKEAGIFYNLVCPEFHLKKGDIMANILDPFDGRVLSSIKAPVDGTVFFAHKNPLVYAKTVLFKMIPFG